MIATPNQSSSHFQATPIIPVEKPPLLPTPIYKFTRSRIEARHLVCCLQTILRTGKLEAAANGMGRSRYTPGTNAANNAKIYEV
jgi:hypothetical protein